VTVLIRRPFIENLQPLRSFLAWSEGTGGSRTFDAFLEIK
jgi:hypothetical protein